MLTSTDCFDEMRMQEFSQEMRKTIDHGQHDSSANEVMDSAPQGPQGPQGVSLIVRQSGYKRVNSFLDPDS